MRLERETQATQRRHYETKIETIERGKDEEISSAKSSGDELLRGKQRLAEQLEQFKAQMTQQKTVMADLGIIKYILLISLFHNYCSFYNFLPEIGYQ